MQRPSCSIPNLDTIPTSMKRRRRWVCWRFDCTGKKWTKTPINALTGGNASSTDPDTWVTFKAAVGRYHRGGVDGIGFMLGWGWAGIDLDDHLDGDGRITPFAEDVLRRLDSYSEVSPSGEGIKIFFRASLEHGHADHENGIEVYGSGRYFAVTGRKLNDSTENVETRQNELRRLLNDVKPPRTTATAPAWRDLKDQDKALAALDQLNLTRADGYSLWVSVGMALHAVDTALLDAWDRWSAQSSKHDDHCCARAWSAFGRSGYTLASLVYWADEDSPGWREQYRVNGAPDHPSVRHTPAIETPPRKPPPMRSVRDLIGGFSNMREPLIFGLLREGETLNLIAASKVGKSWLATNLALTFSTRRKWLGRFDTAGGDVLIVDNELHPETSAYRIPAVANANEIPLNEYADHVFIMNLRGELVNLPQLAMTLDDIEPGRFRLIILDAFYRFLPPGTDENDNGAMASLYNLLDRVAGKLKCAIVCIHHASKGSQSAKAITDVGSGAGSMSRAADCHVVLRPHEEPNVVVMEAATRSWPPLEPLCLRWEFPIFTEDTTLDPTLLKPDRPRRPSRNDPDKTLSDPVWTHHRFTTEFCDATPQTRDAILAKAVDGGLATRKAESLFKLAEGAGLLHTWPAIVRNKRGFATVPPTDDTKKNHTHTPLVPPNTKPPTRRVGVGGSGCVKKTDPIAFGNRDR
ncbi:MAG: AAA family ATPase [Planctomycetia bacterium]|nr:AAA family ATPase [Planctomycetia bacterium]